jgi:hypothetical protein
MAEPSRLIVVLGMLLAALVFCNIATANAQANNETASPPSALSLDSDGVLMLYPSAPGAGFQLGNKDPNITTGLVIEKGTRATAGVDGVIAFWNLPSHALNYGNGGTGWTSRLHILAGGGAQQYTWKTQQGYLFSPTDLRDQEFTVYLRVHRIVDASRAQVSLKIRGGAHSSSTPDRAACVMLTFSPEAHGSITRFAKELTHPRYDYITLTPVFPASLVENVWVGLKMVSWNDPEDATRVVHRLYLDLDPFDPGSGKPRNGWRLFSEYVDVEGKSTGQYKKLVDWGGGQSTLRTDGFHDIDFALPSVRAIVAPPHQP